MSQTRLSDFTFTFHLRALEKEMAIHSSVLAWRIPGMGEPGGLPSMGSRTVGHDWSDLSAYVYIYIYIYIHTHTQIYMHIYIHIYMNLGLHMFFITLFSISFFFNGGWLRINVLVSAIQQCELAINIHRSPHSWNSLSSFNTFHLSRMSQSTGLSSQCYTATVH